MKKYNKSMLCLIIILITLLIVGCVQGSTPEVYGPYGLTVRLGGDTDITLPTTGTLSTTANMNPILTGSYLRIGDAGTTSHSLSSEDDCLVTGNLEVDGTFDFDGNGNFYGNTVQYSGYYKMRDDVPNNYGNSGDSTLIYETEDNNAKVLLFGLPDLAHDANNVPLAVFCDNTKVGTDFGLFNGITEPNIAVVDSDGDSYIRVGFNSDDIAIVKTNAGLIIDGLPTSDPVNAGQLWNDSGTLKVSAGS